MGIIRAGLPLFARQGFAATTTKQIAAAAGVSEALLYKHFPSKESLYAAIEDACCGTISTAIDQVLGMPDDTATLVLIVFGTMHQMISGGEPSWYATEDFDRIMFQSYMSDGLFARLVHERTIGRVLGKLESCLRNAIKAGDVSAAGGPPSVRFWFAQHLAAFLCLLKLQKTELVNYDPASAATFQSALHFALAGIGLRPQAITKHMDIAKLTSAFAALFESSTR